MSLGAGGFVPKGVMASYERLLRKVPESRHSQRHRYADVKQVP